MGEQGSCGSTGERIMFRIKYPMVMYIILRKVPFHASGASFASQSSLSLVMICPMRMRGQQHAVRRDGWMIPYFVHSKISSFHPRVGRAFALGLNGTVRTWSFVQPPAG